MTRQTITALFISVIVLNLAGCASVREMTTGAPMTQFDVQDRLEIINLANSFTIHFDQREWDEYINCFAENSSFTMKDKKGEVLRIMKKNELQDFFAPRIQGFIEQDQRRRHLITNISISEQTATDAALRFNSLLASTDKSDLNFVTTILYDCKFVKVNGAWRIMEITANLDRSLDVKVK